ncbi:MAG: TetR/AcrR family transcriptional regulator [Alphaproteobacteria bacterium]|jgi:AcrR family transcriptional regulator|nr:TetR/AcrR family transcriptional regulator [Alphaproteobacteria bacterium]
MTQLALYGLLSEPVLEDNPFRQEPPKQEPTKQLRKPEPPKEDVREEEEFQEEETREEEETHEESLEVPLQQEEPEEENFEEEEEQEEKVFRKGRPRSQKSRAAILKATNALLLHTSVQELSIEAIAKRAKVGKTTIYRWWPNKTAVVMEALSTQPAMNAPMPTARNNHEALVMQLEKLIRLLHSKNGQTIAQLFSEAQGNEKSQEIFENSFLSPLMDAITFSVAEGCKNGEFRPIDTKMALDLLCGPIFFRLMAHPQEFNEDFEKTFPRGVVRLIAKEAKEKVEK